MSYSDIFRLVDQYSYTGGASAEPQQLMNVLNVLNLARWDLESRIEGAKEEVGEMGSRPDFDIGWGEEEEKKVELGKKESWQMQMEQFQREREYERCVCCKKSISKQDEID